MDWWHEDPELLSATLYMLAAPEADFVPNSSADALALPPATVSATSLDMPVVFSSPAPSSEGDQEVSEAPSTSQAREKQTRRVINVSRERRRDETRYLRAKVTELESQLSILQHRREQMLRPHRSETGEIRSVAAVWEELATRQVRELKRSRLTNAKLKQLIETQLQVAADLLDAIRRAEEESKRQCEQAQESVALSRPRLAIDISKKVSEEEQLARLEVLCTQCHEVFASNSKFQDGTSLRFLDIKLVEDNGVESVVDVFSSWATPFAKEKVEDVMWKFYLEEFAEEEDGHAFQQDYESRDDTIIGVFRALSTIDNHRTTFEGKYVGKRMRCPEGNMVIVSHMYSEPRCKSNLLEDVALEEDSWFRVVRSEDVGGPKLSHPLTVLQHVRRMNIRFGPRHFNQTDDHDDPTDARRRAGALTEFLMLQVEDEMTQGEQCIENMLFDSFNSIALSSSPANPLGEP